MRSVSWLLICISLTVLLLLGIGLIVRPGVTPASTIEVSQDQLSLTAAVAAAAAGDTIRVPEGTYAEPITVSKPLTIVGDGPDQTILTGTKYELAQRGEEGATVIVANADLTLEGVTIGPADTGIMLAGNCTLTLKNCRVTGCVKGLWFENEFQSRLYMIDCEVVGCGDGVDLESTQGQAINCYFHDNEDDGLDLDFDAGFLCVGCTFENNGDDGVEVRLERRTEVVLAFCTFRGNGEDGLELINTNRLDPADNLVAVGYCKFEGNGRYDLGCVDQLGEQTSKEPPHADFIASAAEHLPVRHAGRTISGR